MSVTTCPSCNISVPPGAMFCDNCGYDLRAHDEAAQPSPGVSAGQPVAATYQVSPPEGDINCPSCGHMNIAGSAFCENCGARLVQQPAFVAPPETPAPRPEVTPAAPPVPEAIAAMPKPVPAPAPSMPDHISGFFVIEGPNVTLRIPKGKKTIVIGREDPVSGIFPEIDLDQHGGQDAGVGRSHAQMFLQGGELLIEDLDSVNGTVVNRHKIPSRQPHPVRDGDEIRLGKMVMIYHAE